MNVQNAEKPSTKRHTSVYERECTQETNPLNVTNVANLSERNQHCINVKELIKVKTHMTAMSMATPEKRESSLYVRELTQENVLRVGKPSIKRHTSVYTREHTREINHVSVIDMANPSERNQHCVDIKQLIQKRNLICVKTVKSLHP